ncbi:BrnA antitoxin family protein [Candidatus Magnetomonas plexicatena]|uniref:BrnA antitoxin family protein n=1 Tax=Candidatus Magnetomonas plexicatena TaxID=2552947 RepID=UPI004032AFB5
MKSIDDDFQLKDEYDFSKGTKGRFYKPKKVSTTIRLDDDILMFFKKSATLLKIPYQTMLNDVLRKYVTSHKPPL